MNSRLIVSHLAACILGVGLAYLGLTRSESSSPSRTSSTEAPIEALRDATQIEDTPRRVAALLEFFESTDPKWAQDLRDAVNAEDSPIVLDEVSETLFAAWWARTNPKAAIENQVDPAWANRHPWVREVMRAWVAVDPRLAAEAAGKLPAGPDRGKVEALRVLVDHWWDNPSNTDAGPILALINNLEVRTRASAIARLAEKSLEKRGLEATEAFVEAIPITDDIAFDMRQEVFARYVQALVGHDVDAAVRFASEHMKDREGLGVLRHLAFSWGLKDGPAAMAWALNLPDTATRNRIIMRAWLSFRQAKPEEASEWLMAQEPTHSLMLVYRRYLTGTASLDPKQALAIADKAKDPKLRYEFLTAVGIGWMKTDPTAAAEWLESADLPLEVKDEIRKGENSDPEQLLTPLTEG
ncbi:hypothetical protein K2X89_16770 [Myxococcota bacterium]|nr:hypothetical protein [Myxococcota bacterium]